MLGRSEGKRIETRYAGSLWLRHTLSMQPSARQVGNFGAAVADVVGHVWRGLYHLGLANVLAVDWSSDTAILIDVSDELATWDSDRLTELVVLSHDAGIRLAIVPRDERRVRLLFTPRFFREGPVHLRMPSMETHITEVRHGYRARPSAK